MNDERVLRQTVGHQTRRRLIEALWHSSEPLSARRFFEEYGGGGTSSVSSVGYHLAILEAAGIVKLNHTGNHPDGAAERFYVLGGPNAGEAVRLLSLSA